MLSSLFDKVCKNVEIKLRLLDNERLSPRSAIKSPKVRLNIKAEEFGLSRATAFFDVIMTHVNSKYNQDRPTQMIFEGHEKEKRRYQQRVLDEKIGSSLPLSLGQMVERELVVESFSNI